MDGLAGVGPAPHWLPLHHLRHRLAQLAAGEVTPEMVGSSVTMLRVRGIPDDAIGGVFAECGIAWDPVTNVVRKP